MADLILECVKCGYKTIRREGKIYPALLPIHCDMGMLGEEVEDISPEAGQIIKDLLHSVHYTQVITYLEQTGWRFHANKFVWGKGWFMDPDRTEHQAFLYVKNDPDYPNETYKITLHQSHPHDVQDALQRLAQIEETTFVTVWCKVTGQKQIVLHPIEE